MKNTLSEKLLSIGKILYFHGIQGEVKVGYTAGKESQLLGIKKLYAVTDSKEIPLTVEKIRFHKNFALIKFKEISSIEEAVELKGVYLKAPKAEIDKHLEKDEFYIDDLIGLTAYDKQGNCVGIISSVVNMGAGDLLSVKNTANKEYLVPFVENLVPEVNIPEKKIVINKIHGLLGEEE